MNRIYVGFFIAFFSLLTHQLSAQSDNILLGSRQYEVINRLELLLRKNPELNFSAVKPYNRAAITKELAIIKAKSDSGKIQLSAIDKYNLDIVLNENLEYSRPIGDTSLPIKSILDKSVWSKPYLVGNKKDDLTFFITPIVSFEMGKDSKTTNHSLLINTRGGSMRGSIGKNLGFYTSLTENQELDPLYVSNYVDKQHAVPGTGYYKGYRTYGYDYFNVKGGIMFKANKHIDIQFANDKLFIGNGYRSLILSDFSNNYLFLKINSRFGRFQYVNIFAQMIDTYRKGQDTLLPKKYMAMHYLDFQAAKWLNIAVYENVMFGRTNGYDLNYLNPIIFYNAVQQHLGSPDKLTVGLNIKANPFKNTQFYGQLVVNEFVAHEVFHYKNGWWGNKQAAQIGVKLNNVAKVNNLDVQLEANLVRPFVYTHNETAGAYTHYSQPLAHPLGANFREFIGLVNYQPTKRIMLKFKMMYYEQGLDSAGQNFGSNIFELYNTRAHEYGYHIGSGILAKCMLASATVSYELIPNLFLEANTTQRNYKVVTPGFKDFNTNLYMVGFRWNINRRGFDF